MSILKQSTLQFTPLKVGDFLDTFILRSILHQGAMATLFLAEDRLSEEQVVLKIPCGDILNHPILLYHYQNEERISRKLDHPGIIRFIHRQRSRQYIIMEYVSDTDLRSMVGKNRAIDLDTALSLMSKLCDVVSYLHGKEIIHLDLKPENILLQNKSIIKLIDFGLANCSFFPDLLAKDIPNPQGTPWYIAPEQLLGERSDLRCDIYSMGMLLYEMITGQLPWPRSSKLHIARKRLQHDPTPPRYFNKDIPPQIQDIILRAISRFAKNRYDHVCQLQDDLKNWKQLPITEAGKKTTTISFFQKLFPGPAVQKNSRPALHTVNVVQKPQIIGAVIDYSSLSHMLIELKTQALVQNAEVTLVHVIQDEDDSDGKNYAITVEGELLMARIEQAVQHFRRCSIDPCIRLLRGDVVTVLEKLCVELNAELLILGDSRKKKSFLLSSSLHKKLQKKCSSEILVAKEEHFIPELHLSGIDPCKLRTQQVLVCDIFLIDLWYEHLHFHTELFYQMLLKPKKDMQENTIPCLLDTFIVSLSQTSHYQDVLSILKPIQQQSHMLSERMLQLPKKDHSGLYNLYSITFLPLFCEFKSDLNRISLLLRSYIQDPPPSVPFLSENICPVSLPDLACYGPLLRVLNLDQDICSLIESNDKRKVDKDLGGIN
ncbi:MAG: protein kinase [Desulfocapsa sp.]|nr:protein kinase [Desulfocapsa sp.]